MNIFTSKSFTLRFVLARTWPGLLTFIIALIWNIDPAWVCAAVVISLNLFCLFLDARKLLPLILIAALLLQSAQSIRAEDRPKNPAAACAIIVVVVIAGYCYWRVVKACQNLRPRVLPDEDSTNAAPKSLTQIDIGLWIPNDAESIYCCPATKAAGSATYVQLEVADGGLSIRPALSSTRDDFDDQIVTEGLNPAVSGAQFSHNHQHVATNSITFSDGGAVIAGANPREIVIERSDDLQTWTELARVTLPGYLRLRLTDATDDHQRFYRISK